MSEEYTQVKISMPLIDDIELQRIDNFYNDIVSEYTKAFVKEKEQIIIQRLMKNLQQENQQLKDRINKAVECIESKNNGVCVVNGVEKGAYTFVLDFDKTREFIWELLDLLKGDKE